MELKLSVIGALGPPGAAVLVFELLLNGMALFSHGNIRLPSGLDLGLRHVVVTPDMHRIHHSVILREMNGNFGFNLSWWDRLFGTCREQPEKGQNEMTLGLAQFRENQKLALPRLLLLPFTKNAARQPSGR